MAEESTSHSVQGPNGETLKVNLTERSIGISTKDLLPLLVVIGAFIGGLLIAKVLFLGQAKGSAQLEGLLAATNESRQALMGRMHDVGQDITGSLVKQNDLVQAQTIAIEGFIRNVQVEHQQQMSQLRQWLSVVLATMHNPEQQYQLDLPPQQVK